MAFWKVTVKADRGKTRSFWAKDRQRGRAITTYLPVNKEGEDYSQYKRIKGKDTLVIKKVGYSNDLIVRECPAIEDRTYGTLKVMRGKRRRRGRIIRG